MTVFHIGEIYYMVYEQIMIDIKGYQSVFDDRMIGTGWESHDEDASLPQKVSDSR